MRQGNRPDTPPINVLRTADEQRTCYRCGKAEPRPHAFRQLPGSRHIIVCPECYRMLWGWKEQKGKEHPR